MPSPMVIFFDLGDTLVIPRLDASGDLTRLEVLPFVPEVLDRLRVSAVPGRPGARLGVMSNTPAGYTLPRMRALVEAAGLLDKFESPLLLFSSVEGVTKSEREFFHRGASRAGVPPARCIFVGEDAAERAVARSAGLHVSFHPLHVFSVLEVPA